MRKRRTMMISRKVNANEALQQLTCKKGPNGRYGDAQTILRP